MQFYLIIVVITIFANILHFEASHAVVSQSKDAGLTICENVYEILTYPRTVTRISVINASPLRVRVHLLAQGPTKSVSFTVEGMVCDADFDQNAANAACRSANASKAVFFSGIEWQDSSDPQKQACILDTGDYKSTIPCEYILHHINCPSSAYGLHECRYPEFFAKSSLCNRYTHVGLMCF